MGHYDDCYAYDYAKKNEKNITIGDIEALEKRVEKEGVISCYTEDSNHALMALVASKSNKLEVVGTDYKQFKIQSLIGKNICT